MFYVRSFLERKTAPRSMLFQILWTAAQLHKKSFLIDDLLRFGSQRLDYNAYMHTYSRGKLGLYINRWMTLKVTQGHWKWRYLIGRIALLVTDFYIATTSLSCTVSEILPLLQLPSCLWPWEINLWSMRYFVFLPVTFCNLRVKYLSQYMLNIAKYKRYKSCKRLKWPSKSLAVSNIGNVSESSRAYDLLLVLHCNCVCILFSFEILSLMYENEKGDVTWTCPFWE